MSTEQWRPLPGHPRYQLSNQGRLRSPNGLMTPNTTTAAARSARYQLYIPETRRQASVTVRAAMRTVWRVEFEPTDTWIKQVRAEVQAEVAATKTAPRGKAQVAPRQRRRSADTRPTPSDGMPCPWESGQLDTRPPGVESWDSPEMDPMTHRGENGVWFYVPKTAKERREIRREYGEKHAKHARVAA